jgi:hypothetical protein
VCCNRCGGEMQARASLCPRCSSAFGLVGIGAPGTYKQRPSLPTATEPSGYYFGRFYAWSKIAGGSILGLMIFFHAPWVSAFQRPELELTAVLSLVTGYGLLKKQMWALYLMTVAFSISILRLVTASERHSPVHLMPLGIVWNLIGLSYFWEHRRQLE